MISTSMRLFPFCRCHSITIHAMVIKITAMSVLRDTHYTHAPHTQALKTTLTPSTHALTLHTCTHTLHTRTHILHTHTHCTHSLDSVIAHSYIIKHTGVHSCPMYRPTWRRSTQYLHTLHRRTHTTRNTRHIDDGRDTRHTHTYKPHIIHRKAYSDTLFFSSSHA